MPAGGGVVAIMTLVVERLIERGVRSLPAVERPLRNARRHFQQHRPRHQQRERCSSHGPKSGADARLAHCLIKAVTRLIWISQPTLV